MVKYSENLKQIQNFPVWKIIYAAYIINNMYAQL
jgi:hypothetical protein